MAKKKAIGLNEDGMRLADLEGLTAAPEESAYYTLGNTYKDTASLKSEEGETTECECEEYDDPEDEFETPGKTTLEFATSDLDPESCHKAYGGELSSDKKTWTAPDNFATKYVAVMYTTRSGITTRIGRAKMSTTWDWTISKSGYGLLRHKLTVLRPTIEGVKKMQVSID